MWQKVKGLYFPYVVYSLLFLLLTNLFFRWNIVDYQLSGKEMLGKAFKIVTFRGNQPLLNGYWFLKTLVGVTVPMLVGIGWSKAKSCIKK